VLKTARESREPAVRAAAAYAMAAVESGELIAGPDLVAKGLKPELNDGALAEAERELRKTLERRARGEPQYGHLVSRAKETVSKTLYRRSKSRPMILPVVTEL